MCIEVIATDFLWNVSRVVVQSLLEVTADVQEDGPFYICIGRILDDNFMTL